MFAALDPNGSAVILLPSLLPPLSPCSDACAILDDINGDTPKLDASKERVMHICKAIVQ